MARASDPLMQVLQKMKQEAKMALKKNIPNAPFVAGNADHNVGVAEKAVFAATQLLTPTGLKYNEDAAKEIINYYARMYKIEVEQMAGVKEMPLDKTVELLTSALGTPVDRETATVLTKLVELGTPDNPYRVRKASVAQLMYYFGADYLDFEYKVKRDGGNPSQWKNDAKMGGERIKQITNQQALILYFPKEVILEALNKGKSAKTLGKMLESEGLIASARSRVKTTIRNTMMEFGPDIEGGQYKEIDLKQFATLYFALNKSTSWFLFYFPSNLGPVAFAVPRKRFKDFVIAMGERGYFAPPKSSKTGYQLIWRGCSLREAWDIALSLRISIHHHGPALPFYLARGMKHHITHRPFPSYAVYDLNEQMSYQRIPRQAEIHKAFGPDRIRNRGEYTYSKSIKDQYQEKSYTGRS